MNQPQTSSPADELRQAAALIRSTAAKATPGPWQTDGAEIYDQGRDWVAESLDLEGAGRGDDNAAHIALWHPGVALAVADWLDAVAADMVRNAGVPGYDWGQALTAARLILGSAS